MLVVFRCDASIQIGSGHVMRCLTLADSLSEQGVNCYFITRFHEGNIADYIEQRGYETHRLPLKEQNIDGVHIEPIDYQHWLGTNIHTDANETLNIVKKISANPIDWIIVDHYALDKVWEQILHPYCKQMMVIDDLANRAHVCDLLLDQTLGRSKKDYKNLTSTRCTLLTGSQYALLRPEFVQLRKHNSKRRKTLKLKKLLITLGGVDKDNITECILNNLQDCILPQDCRIVIVMGEHAPWIEAVKKQAAQMKWQTDVLVNIENMAQLMTESDLCIGAAGTTAIERCCLGLPTLLIVAADNQIKTAEKLEKYGAVINLGRTDCDYMKNLHSSLKSLIDDRSRYNSLVENCFNITDGNGIYRVAQRISPATLKTEEEVYLRLVNEDDARMLYEWQSNNTTRQYSRNTETPTWDEHAIWFESKIADTKCVFYIIICNSKPAGYIRLDQLESKELEFEISIAIAPSMRSRGLGKIAINLLKYIHRNESLIATVLEDNKVSHRLFQKTGFKFDKNRDVYIFNTIYD